MLSVTQNHTSSLEDHSRQLTNAIGQMTQLIAGTKASGAMRKMLPSATSPTKSYSSSRPPPQANMAAATAVVATEVTEDVPRAMAPAAETPLAETTTRAEEAPMSHPLQQQSDLDLSDLEFDRIEKKFSSMKTSASASASLVEKCQSSKS